MNALRGVLGASLTVIALAAMPGAASAQRLDLAVAPAAIVIPTGDPDLVPVVSSAPAAVEYRVRQNESDPWVLTVLAAGDLVSGASTIAISEVSWVAAPSPPFRNGTLSSSVAQTVAAGTGNVQRPSTGSITFRLTNSWTYDAGIYTQSLLFTLSVP
jgi:hypothetical protein